jgi:hypothetical protein
VPISVERVIARALEKQPADRFETMADFWVAFEQCLGRSRHGAELSVARARAAAPDDAEPSTMPGVRWRGQPVADVDRTVVDDRPPGMDDGTAALRAVVTDPALHDGLTDPRGFRAAMTDPAFEVPTGVEARPDAHVSTTERYLPPINESGAQASIVDSPPLDDATYDERGAQGAPGGGAGASAARVTANVRLGSGASRTWLLLVAAMVMLLGVIVGMIIYFVSDVPAWPTAHPDAAGAPTAPARR